MTVATGSAAGGGTGVVGVGALFVAGSVRATGAGAGAAAGGVIAGAGARGGGAACPEGIGTFFGEPPHAVRNAVKTIAVTGRQVKNLLLDKDSGGAKTRLG
jgi:hypothetical protein